MPLGKAQGKAADEVAEPLSLVRPAGESGLGPPPAAPAGAEAATGAALGSPTGPGDQEEPMEATLGSLPGPGFQGDPGEVPGAGLPGREGKASKPFQLARYFSSVGVIIIFITCLALAAMTSDRAEKIIYDRVVEDTIMIMDNVNVQMFNNFLLPIYRERGEAKLSQAEPYRLINSVIKNTIHGFDISKVALYDARFGMMVYSSESNDPVVTYQPDPVTGEMVAVGNYAEPMDLYSESIRIYLSKRDEDNSGPSPREIPNYQQAPGSPARAEYINYLKERTVIVRQEGGYLFGKFFPRGQFTIRCLKAMEDYYTHNISGVLELNRDLTSEYREIGRMHFMALVVAVASSLFLSVILWMIVVRGESIINQKNAEKAALDERLNQAERLANLGKMVETVSHEIRNPLGIIRSSADFLATGLKDKPSQRRIAGAIVDESERLWRILTDFLDFARPMKPVLTAVVVEDLLEEILVLLEADMSRAGVELLVKTRPDPGPILADRDQLHRAFLNLLVNAIQAMPDGGLLTVASSVQMAGDPQGRVIVTIQDTGPGLSAEASSHLFRPFHTTKTKGTGLGLVLVRNVIESHLGRLGLENVKGDSEDHGLLVTVSLPLKPPGQLETSDLAEDPDPENSDQT
jgi:signal transduction histidine kinase